MTTRNLVGLVSVSHSLFPKMRATGVATGDAVDLQGYDSASIVVAFGDYTNGSHLASVQHSDDDSNYSDCVFGVDIKGHSNFSAIATAPEANSAQELYYVGNKRYLKVVMTTTGGTNGAVSSAFVIKGHPHH